MSWQRSGWLAGFFGGSCVALCEACFCCGRMCLHLRYTCVHTANIMSLASIHLLTCTCILCSITTIFGMRSHKFTHSVVDCCFHQMTCWGATLDVIVDVGVAGGWVRCDLSWLAIESEKACVRQICRIDSPGPVRPVNVAGCDALVLWLFDVRHVMTNVDGHGSVPS